MDGDIQEDIIQTYHNILAQVAAALAAPDLMAEMADQHQAVKDV